MAYTPTSWTTGDTITAAAMNKIENGIASSTSSKMPVYKITTTTGPSWERALEWFYAYKSGNTYTLLNSANEGWHSSWQTIVPTGDHTSVGTAPISLTDIEGLCVFLAIPSGMGTVTAKSGGISDLVTSTNSASGYEITGDFSITFNGT